MHNIILGKKLRAKRDVRFKSYYKIHAGEEVIVTNQSWSGVIPSIVNVEIQYRDPNRETDELEYDDIHLLQEDFEILTEE